MTRATQDEIERVARQLIELSRDPANRYALSVAVLDLALSNVDADAPRALVEMADALGPRDDGDYGESHPVTVDY